MKHTVTRISNTKNKSSPVGKQLTNFYNSKLKEFVITEFPCQLASTGVVYAFCESIESKSTVTMFLLCLKQPAHPRYIVTTIVGILGILRDHWRSATLLLTDGDGET